MIERVRGKRGRGGGGGGRKRRRGRAIRGRGRAKTGRRSVQAAEEKTFTKVARKQGRSNDRGKGREAKEV